MYLQIYNCQIQNTDNKIIIPDCLCCSPGLFFNVKITWNYIVYCVPRKFIISPFALFPFLKAYFTSKTVPRNFETFDKPGLTGSAILYVIR